jgi:23S rRNA pseudouridine2605 synthase
MQPGLEWRIANPTDTNADMNADKGANRAANQGADRGRRVHLERALSKLGLMSRGEAAKAIAAGEVLVNGRVASDARAWVDWQGDVIECMAPGKGAAVESGESRRRGEGAGPASAGRPHSLRSQSLRQAPRYGILHKPRGYVVTRSDELGRGKEVFGLLPAEAREGWVFAVGRLDKDSEGLLLFTDDGAWAERLTGPDSHVAKVYRVKLNARASEEALVRFRGGVELDGRMTLPCQAEADGGAWVRVILREGRNRQIRRMFHALGYKVMRLLRVAIGPLVLDESLAPGGFRWLTSEEVKALRG